MRPGFMLHMVCLLATILVLSGASRCADLTKPKQIHVGDHILIKNGMTEEDVEAVVGGPAGDYSTKLFFGEESMNCESALWSVESYLGDATSDSATESLGQDMVKEWTADEGEVEVHFQHGKVTSYFFTPGAASPSTDSD